MKKLRCRSQHTSYYGDRYRCEESFGHAGPHGAGAPFTEDGGRVRPHYAQWSDYAGTPRWRRWFRDSKLERRW